MDNDLQNIDTPSALVKAAPEIGDMFFTLQAYEMAKRMANTLAQSNMLPDTYKDKPQNCMVLLSIAGRFRHMGVDPFIIAQQLVPVNGKFGWQGQFVIAVVNQSGRFDTPLKFEFTGEGDTRACQAFVMKDGERLNGAKITMEMVRAEGWYGKSGSKWKTMPDQMFMYRAGAFFGRIHCPDLLMGFHTAEEIEDIGMKDVTPTKGDEMTKTILGDLNQAQPVPIPNVDKTTDSMGRPLKVEESKGFTPPTAPANPKPAFFDDTPKPTVKLGEIGKLRKDSVVDDVDDQIPF